ncbi:MAG TPA: hypothetical protein VK812_19905 [Candidatus Binatus sp.]|jgi:hypothetical protein|nr:hypothetical protein [Candidatus Binatus sp.]
MINTANNPAWLEWMTTLMNRRPASAVRFPEAESRKPGAELSQEGVSRHTYAATLPPDRFYCLLDELPLHLVPQRVIKSLQLHEDRNQPYLNPLYLNPQCIVCPAGRLPEELAMGMHPEVPAGFALQGTIAWVRSPATGNLLPFWLGPQLEGVVRNLRPNEPAPASMPEGAQRLLAAADILLSEDRMSQRLRQHEEMIQKAAPRFREKGYAPLGDLIHPFHIAALRRYYRYLIRTGAIHLGDGQSPRRYVAYNEPVARFFHHDIAATLSAVAGEPLKPSYVYLASYLSGAVLKKHTDRAQCEFSVTLCLDFSPEPALETPWPIRLDTPTSTVTVYQALGDGLAYRGTRLPHYRSALREGQTSTSIFFHYVAEDFPGSLD